MNETALQALRQRDYAQYLALWLVPPERRPFALALFALEAELRATPAKVTEPTLGLLRIVWWRDAVAEGAIKQHPLLQALQPQLGGQTDTVAAWVETFDAPFLADGERPARVAERQGLAVALLGKKAAHFVVESQKKTPLRLLFGLIREII